MSILLHLFCRQTGIRFAMVRVILDIAGLPLDFNRLLTPKQQMSYFKLGEVRLKSPEKIVMLKKLQKLRAVAAGRLAQALVKITPSQLSRRAAASL